MHPSQLRQLWGRFAGGTAEPAAPDRRGRTAIADGYFYHTIDLPEHDTIAGAWDLRGATDAYLGFVDLAGKRVLEVGAANGFLTFEMEARGANVVAYDLSPEFLGDIMPVPGLDLVAFERKYRGVAGGLNRAWWYAHEVNGSHATLVNGSAYEIPAELGPFDLATFGCILLHLRDPFAALVRAAPLVRERIVVTDTLNPPFAKDAIDRGMVFDPSLGRDPCSWWSLSPSAVKRMLAVLGFGRSEIHTHRQVLRPDFAPWGHTRLEDYRGPEVEGELFTVVAARS